MAEGEFDECTWVVKNVKRIYEDKLSMRSPVFSTRAFSLPPIFDYFHYRLLISTKTKENMSGCYEVTKEKQYIALYLQNLRFVLSLHLLKVTFSIINPIEGKVLSKSTTIFNIKRNQLGGIQDFISIPKLEKLNLEDLVIKCEIQAIHRDFTKFKLLLNNNLYSDIELLVGDKKYPAHKLVLAVSSKVFRDQFYRQDALSKIKIDDMDPKVLYELLRFMYTGTVEYMDKITCQVFNVTVKYDVSDFFEQFRNVLNANLNVENVIPNFLSCYENYQGRLLLKDMFSVFIVKNIKTIMKLGKCTELVRIAPEFISHILVNVSTSRKKNGYKKDENWQISKNLYLNDKVQSQKQYETFLNDKTFSDVEIHVGDQKYSAHKIVLAVRSPVFKSMFSHNMLEAVSGMVKVEDVEPEVFYQMLRFIYTNEVENDAKTDDLMQQLLIVADRYEISDLRRECEIILTKNITAENVVNTLKFADKFNAEGLKNKCLEYVIDHFCLGPLKQNSSSWNEYALNKALGASHPHLLLDLLTMITVNYKPL